VKLASFGEKLLRWVGYWMGLTGGENEWVLEVFDCDDWDEKVSEQSKISFENEKKIFSYISIIMNKHFSFVKDKNHQDLIICC
jgi:hypothetical protein